MAHPGEKLAIAGGHRRGRDGNPLQARLRVTDLHIKITIFTLAPEQRGNRTHPPITDRGKPLQNLAQPGELLAGSLARERAMEKALPSARKGEPGPDVFARVKREPRPAAAGVLPEVQDGQGLSPAGGEDQAEHVFSLSPTDDRVPGGAVL